jgi:hypothetical protein
MSTKAKMFSQALKAFKDLEFIDEHGDVVAIVNDDGKLEFSSSLSPLSDKDVLKFISWLNATFVAHHETHKQPDTYDLKDVLPTDPYKGFIGVCRNGAIRIFDKKNNSNYYKWFDLNGLCHLYDLPYRQDDTQQSDYDIIRSASQIPRDDA